MSDILRDLAELLDQHEGTGADMSQNSTHQRMSPAQVAEPELSDSPLMVPPLQQKHELLKKVAGVDNTYGGDEQQGNNELDRMKKMAGIVIAGDENDVN